MKRLFRSLDLAVLSCLFLAAASEPELVKNIDCYIDAPKRAHCSWVADSNVRDLRCFYQIFKEDLTVSFYDPPPPIVECSWYSFNSSSRAGFDLQAKITDEIKLTFNGKLNNKIVTHNLTKLDFKLRPPALTWTVIEARDAFNISWILPDVAPAYTWKTLINYSECGEWKAALLKRHQHCHTNDGVRWQTISFQPVDQCSKGTMFNQEMVFQVQTIEAGATAHQLPRVSRCRYAIAIKAENDGRDKEQTPLSLIKYFEAISDPNVAMYAIIILPLMLAVLTALAVVCCRKNKKYIFPEVPKPLDLLSDISENNNKCMTPNLYVVAEEEEGCKITLVTDPQITKPAS